MRPQAAVVALSAQQLEQRFDVFLTHDWGTDGEGRRTHERVAAVHRALKVRPSHTLRQPAQLSGTAKPHPAAPGTASRHGQATPSGTWHSH